MRRLLALALLVLAGCSAVATPSFPPELNLVNRGGPAFVLSINGTDVATVRCNVGVQALAPGVAGVPALPWHLTVTRQRDGRVIYTADVTQLPLWLVQIGEDFGTGTAPVSGPPGPKCPPTG